MFKPTIGDAPTIAGNSMGTMLANRYRVVRPLGHGGMGSVWLAEDVKLDNRPFAIKMLPSIFVDNRRAYEQVKREALIALKLVHPNIVQIRALEEASEGGNPFLVMDFIDGQTLDDYLVEHTGTTGVSPVAGIPEADVVRILTPVAAALDYAHAKGVVHRDVKPGNVMIAKDGTPIVLDFGIAREIQETMTRVTGKLSSGTLTYMSPEQLHGAVPKPAQDVYSFAAMAYECLTGTPPFARGQIEYQIDHDAPAPLPDGIGIAPGIMAGLAKKPENRPATCAAVLGRSGVPPLHEAPAGNAPVADSESAEGASVPQINWFVGLLALVIAVIAGVVLWVCGSNVQGPNPNAVPDARGISNAQVPDARGISNAQAPDAKGNSNVQVLDAKEEGKAEKIREAEPIVDKPDPVISTKTINLPGGAKMEMIYVEPGSSTEGFWLGKYEVTQEQWRSVMGTNPSRWSGDKLPVENVSWHDCQRFIAKLNDMPEVKASGLRYRLPAEAEWEYACRAGGAGEFCRLADDAEIAEGTLGKVAWYNENSDDGTHPVGQKIPNAFGFYDMHGNVWEWCEDLYRAGRSNRVGRGGGWNFNSRYCTAGYRDDHLPDYRDDFLGFRLAASQDVNR